MYKAVGGFGCVCLCTLHLSLFCFFTSQYFVVLYEHDCSCIIHSLFPELQTSYCSLSDNAQCTHEPRRTFAH